MWFKKINFISFFIVIFNLILFYIFDIKSSLQIFLYNFLLAIIIISILKFIRDLVKKEGFYILYKKIEKEFSIYSGVFLIVGGIINLGFSLDNGFLLPGIYLIISLLEKFIEEYFYNNEKLRKIVIKVLFVCVFLLVPIFLLTTAYFAIKYNLDIENILKGSFLIFFGFGLICLVVYSPKKLRNKTKIK